MHTLITFLIKLPSNEVVFSQDMSSILARMALSFYPVSVNGQTHCKSSQAGEYFVRQAGHKTMSKMQSV